MGGDGGLVSSPRQCVLVAVREQDTGACLGALIPSDALAGLGRRMAVTVSVLLCDMCYKYMCALVVVGF